jgi:hypothetical protein
MPTDHHFLINGCRWLWRYTRLRGNANGWTFYKHPSNQTVNERVLVDSRLKGRSRLETEIHEFLHASNPTHSEEHVTQQGRDLARILWCLGYRLKEGAANDSNSGVA